MVPADQVVAQSVDDSDSILHAVFDHISCNDCVIVIVLEKMKLQLNESLGGCWMIRTEYVQKLLERNLSQVYFS